MYCKCTNGYNYQVEGVCDIKDFTPITSREWKQIVVPEILSIPECYPNIEEIERVYVNVVITSTRIIETPSSNGNVEGVNLTGYKLIVDGDICQTVVYTADDCHQSLHSINFKYPFCTYIVINNDIDICDDKYCVKVCVEDLFAKVLNSRTIFKSVSLFLAAVKVSDVCTSTGLGENTITTNITNTTADSIKITINIIDKDEIIVASANKIVDSGAGARWSKVFSGICNGVYTVEIVSSKGTVSNQSVVVPPSRSVDISIS